MRTAVALGSNLGDRLSNLRAARQAILGFSNVKPPVISSAVYETEPVACEPGAEKFLNAVVEFDYEGDPLTLLEQLIRVEETLGRNRQHARNVSRTIDIDLLYCGEHIIEEKTVRLPHPRVHLRKFVLQPLSDIRSDLILPRQNKTVGELLEDFEECSEIVRVVAEW